MRSVVRRCRAFFGSRWAGGLFLCVFGGLMLAGCEEEGIHQYSAHKAETPEKVRLIGIIYPHGGLTWFFKLMGPDSAVAEQGESLAEFMQSVQFPEKGERPIEWKLPDGWQPVADAKAKTPERYATLRLASKDASPLELTVTKFPGAAGGLLANVNRWRGQIGLPPVGEDELDTVKKEEFKGGVASIVNLLGPGLRAPGSGAPFMELPGAAPDKAPFQYTKPKGWEDSPNLNAGGVKRVAVFKATDGDQSAEISVTPLAGDAGGLSANVNRWRRQVGLKPVEEVREKDFAAVEVAGAALPLIELRSDDGKNRMVGVLVPHGGMTWVFKMAGPSDVVEKQKSRFQEFLKSVKFDGDKGGEK